MVENNQSNQNQPEKIKPAIRTMRSDVQELLKTTKSSLIQIVGQETVSAPAAPQGGLRFKKYVPLVLTALGAAAVILTAALFIFPKKDGAPATKLVPPAPFFAVEASRTITIKPQDRSQMLRMLGDSAQEKEREGIVKRVLIKVLDGPTERFILPQDFFEILRVNPPAGFLASTQPPLMTFFYYSGGGPRFGMALRSSDPDRLMAQLLTWESSFLSDFLPLFFGEKPEVIISPFEDRTYRNVDWRFIKLSQEKDLGLGYTIFPAGNILVITTGKEAMEVVVSRLFDAR
ncbi:MAG: hypothetical protein HYW89_02520 [Candidatus Sungiibacteriota bacterium]|uniref:Uncharacterized protein n=1 Tax=Candidatus Sungiibacteriota bacterium TaxID=2750080 RepID=A0A7T5RJL8_9BACT|nr:MAG: hypothetical protein HYW89_02520 [Candidatus Sungbacteria bacterium]